MTLMHRKSATADPVSRRTQRARHSQPRSSGGRFRRWVATTSALAIPAALIVQVGGIPATNAAPAPTGNGFVVTAGDLAFILKQIKIAERHSATLTADNPCGTLVGPNPDQIPDRLTSYGLRTVDGSCNNLFAGREKFAAADVPFPRLTTPDFRDAEASPNNFFGPGSGVVPSNGGYKQKLAGNNVFDSQPRTVSNLIVDQTSTNPAAIAAAGFPVRTQRNPGKFPCTTDPAPDGTGGVPDNCVPTGDTLFIPNVTTDVGLSPPYNSLFTFFGQFFDHGVDQTVKSGATVFVPLKADDPLITVGPDHKPNTGDEVPPGQQFMVLTRAQNQPGPDGKLGTADDIQDANNTDSPWVDQSQTYTSHASHQVFLREYVNDASGKPISTGKLLGGLPVGQTYFGSPDDQTGISTWASTKKQAAELLGLKLVDKDVLNIPMLATDPYGNFIPGPARGLPQYVTMGPDGKVGTADDALVEGDRANGGVPVPTDVVYFDTPFLVDIAHNADPSPVDTDHNPGTPPVAPTPDLDNTPSADFAHQPAGTYDDEMLNSHHTCGDGRCNENIALTTIHQVFHSEHDRLVDDIQKTLTANPALEADYKAAHPFGTPSKDISYGFGGRLFQAARFVTEMEYQHLVFEEFGRKVQPAIRPFHVYSPDIQPAIQAEFAHAVYRFGHSMLDDDVARSGPDVDTTGVLKDHSLKLLNAFLNPPAYQNGGSAGTLTPEQAAGSIVMGSSDQAGNELDEFVTETLRDNLLGLPLDLPTINMARARSEGVPRLNDLRRQIFAKTNDGQLTPYTDWSDYGQHLKHPESLINFVAAYGTHPSITSQTTLAGKRAAAQLIVDPQPTKPGPDGVLGTPDDIPAQAPPADASDFMFSAGSWAGKETGLNDVDLWIGGLAEVTNLFGGLLGSTFNYVFQTQMENLQDGDRLYYLARTPGMNLRTQLEGNSFSEMIQRNTEGTNTLKADAFATADCKFQLGNLEGTVAGYTAHGSLVADDPATPDCDESLLLLRSPDGTIAYKQRNTVDPSGINSQSVYNGTAGVDRVKGGNDNDTFWGGGGNDVIDGQGGDDIALGGDGNDIITDLDGADVPKGGPGNDAIDGGPGDDIPMGNDGADFINGGANDNETFAGEGNDYVIAGQGADAVFGDGGDDWIEGGTGQDLLQGDHGAPFFDDPAESTPGNEVMVGQIGENDYDAEGGDDIMAQNAQVDRNAGAGGFDWATHQYDTVAADDDMMINNNLGGLPIQVIVNRDRWQETEADSGGPLNDTLKGTDGALATPRLIAGGGFSGCDAIDVTGRDRIAGLADLLPPVAQWPGTAAEVAALSASGACPLTGPVWGEGDILLGGPGTDTITGRTGDDIIDGDKELQTMISVRDSAGVELGTTDLMESKALTGTFGPGTTNTTGGMTLQQAVFAGLVDPGNLVTVRKIVNKETLPADCAATAPKNCDVATFAGPQTQYTITNNANGSITVADNNSTSPATAAVPATGDGFDTLFNVEQLKFGAANPVPVPTVPTGPVATVPLAATGLTASAGTGQVTLSWTPGADGGSPLTSQQITVTGGTTAVPTVTVAANATTATVTGLTNGTTYTFQVQGINAIGTGATATATATPVAAPPVLTAPGVPAIGTATAGIRSATVSWTPATTGGAPVSYLVQARNAAGTVLGTSTVTAGGATGATVTVPNGVTVRLRVRATNAVGTSAFSGNSNAVTTPNLPGAPVIGVAVAGVAGAPVNATARWTPPAANGGSPITGYVVRGLRLSAAGAVLSTTTSAVQPATARTLALTLPVSGANYRFTVQAITLVGAGAQSARSNQVVGR